MFSLCSCKHLEWNDCAVPQDRRSSYAFWSHCIAHNIELQEKETSKRNQEGLPIRLSCFHLLDVQPFLTRAENDWIFPSQKLNDIAHFSSTIYLRIYFYLTVKNSNKPCNNNNNDNERNVLSLKEFSIRKTRDSRFLFTRKNSISPARGQPSIDSIDKRPFRTIFNISTDETKIAPNISTNRISLDIGPLCIGIYIAVLRRPSGVQLGQLVTIHSALRSWEAVWEVVRSADTALNTKELALLLLPSEETAFVLPAWLEPVQRGRGEGRAKRSVDFLTRSPNRSTNERARASIGFDSATFSPRSNYHVSSGYRDAVAAVASSETVARLVSTPPVWCFQPNAGSCTLSVVNLRTVRRLNRNANLYTAADLRAARSVLAWGVGGRALDAFVSVYAVGIPGLFRTSWNWNGAWWINFVSMCWNRSTIWWRYYWNR